MLTQLVGHGEHLHVYSSFFLPHFAVILSSLCRAAADWWVLTVSDLLFENGDFVLQLNYELARSWCWADKDPGGDRMQRPGARAALSLLTAARTRHWLPPTGAAYI